MYVTTTDVSPADEQSKPDGCTVNMKHVRLSRAVTSETAPRTFECCNDLVAREAMTGEKTKQLKQEQPQHQSLINEISELNTKLKTDGETLFNMETHYLYIFLLCKTVTLLISFSNSFQIL